MSDVGVPAPADLTTRLQLRYADLNAGGHVSNTAVGVLFDEARARVLGYPAAPGAAVTSGLLHLPGHALTTLVGQVSVEYHHELFHRGQDVEVRSWVSGLGRSRFALSAALLDDTGPHARVVAVCDCTVVVVDAGSGRPVPLPDALRDRLSARSAPAVPLRARLTEGIA